jgi:hypothetical protein
MKNRKLTLLTRAKMSLLSQLRHLGDTDAEEHLQRAISWVNTAIERVVTHKGGEEAAMMNASTHLELASRTLGFIPVTLR